MELINAASAARHFAYAVLKVAIPKEPSLLNEDRLIAKMDHIAEELNELQDSANKGDIVEQADGFIDIIYIALGGLAEMGLAHKAQDLFEAVHLANMQKVNGVVAKRGAAHDAVKPEGWKAPNLRDIIWPIEKQAKVRQELLDLIVTRNGVKIEDQEAAIKEFVAACRVEHSEKVKTLEHYQKMAEEATADFKAKDTPEATVKSRKELYGSFEGRAVVCDAVMQTLRSHPNWSRKLEPIHRHGLTMLVEKIGRIIEGNPNYLDNWHDAGGYSHLVETELKESGRGF